MAVKGSQDGDTSEIFSFFIILRSFESDKYFLSEIDSNRCSFSRSKALNNCAYSFENTENDTFNIVDITWIDNDKRHIAGTFQFRMTDQKEGCIDTSYVTDGRFDLQFQTTP